MNQNSGGWRYGNGGSNQFLYRNEEVDNDLLRRAAEVAAPKGLLDTKIEASPIDKYLQQDSGSGGDYGGNQGTPGNVSNTMGIESKLGWGGPNLSAAKAGSVLGLPGAVLGGLLGGITSSTYSNQKTVDDFDMSNFGITGSQMDAARANSAAMTSMQDALNADTAALNGGGSGGGYGGGGTNSDGGTGDTGSDGVGGGMASGDSRGSDGANADGNFYKGGMVRKGLLSGPNPKGPDDGYGGLQHGEYVIKASAVKKYGKGLLDAINTEKYKG